MHFLDESGSLLCQTAELRPGDKVSNGGRGYLRHGCDLVGFVKLVVEDLLSERGSCKVPAVFGQEECEKEKEKIKVVAICTHGHGGQDAAPTP